MEVFVGQLITSFALQSFRRESFSGVQSFSGSSRRDNRNPRDALAPRAPSGRQSPAKPRIFDKITMDLANMAAWRARNSGPVKEGHRSEPPADSRLGLPARLRGSGELGHASVAEIASTLRGNV